MGWAFQSLFRIKSLKHFPPLDYSPPSELSPQVFYIHLHVHFLEKWGSVFTLPLSHSVEDLQWLSGERRHRTLKGRVKFRTWQMCPVPTLAPLVLPAGAIFNSQCKRTCMMRGCEPLWFPCVLWVSLVMISQGISNWGLLDKPRLKTIYIFVISELNYDLFGFCSMSSHLGVPQLWWVGIKVGNIITRGQTKKGTKPCSKSPLKGLPRTSSLSSPSFTKPLFSISVTMALRDRSSRFWNLFLVFHLSTLQFISHTIARSCFSIVNLTK